MKRSQFIGCNFNCRRNIWWSFRTSNFTMSPEPRSFSNLAFSSLFPQLKLTDLFQKHFENTIFIHFQQYGFWAILKNGHVDLFFQKPTVATNWSKAFTWPLGTPADEPAVPAHATFGGPERASTAKCGFWSTKMRMVLLGVSDGFRGFFYQQLEFSNQSAEMLETASFSSKKARDNTLRIMQG